MAAPSFESATGDGNFHKLIRIKHRDICAEKCNIIEKKTILTKSRWVHICNVEKKHDARTNFHALSLCTLHSRHKLLPRGSRDLKSTGRLSHVKKWGFPPSQMQTEGVWPYLLTVGAQGSFFWGGTSMEGIVPWSATRSLVWVISFWLTWGIYRKFTSSATQKAVAGWFF